MTQDEPENARRPDPRRLASARAALAAATEAAQRSGAPGGEASDSVSGSSRRVVARRRIGPSGIVMDPDAPQVSPANPVTDPSGDSLHGDPEVGTEGAEDGVAQARQIA
ncbi:MAG: hypothetical protein WBG57_03590, partial [Ornithinimicrobium sp.]